MIAWLAAAAWGTEDFRSYLDQARFFLRKEWHADAEEQLALAVATEDGKLDPEAWFLLAKVRYELCDLAGARFAADRALIHSRDRSQVSQTHELLSFFEDKFGILRLVAPHDGVATRVEISLESTIFDPDLKSYIHKMTARLAEPVVLPIDLGLPAGAYRVNGADVVIEAGGFVELAPEIRGAGAARLQTVEVELGLGGAAWLGRAATSLLPAPTADLSVGVPIGRVVLGATASWTPQPYATRSQGLGVRFGGSVGARAGIELAGTQPFVLRPSVTYRGGLLPGIEVGCAEQDGNWSCARDAEVRQLYIYTSPVVHAAGLELAALYHDRSRKSGIGVGLKAHGEVGLGRLPSTSAADRGDERVTFSIADPDRPFTAFGVRVLLSTSYQF